LIAAVLVATVFFYDAVHKIFEFSPVLMAGCRFLLYLVAASMASGGVTVWRSGAGWLAATSSVTYLARAKACAACCVTATGLPARAGAAGVARQMRTIRRWSAWCFGGAAAWEWASRFASRCGETSRSSAGPVTTARGIVLVDWLAIVSAPQPVRWFFLGLFVLALVFQRFVPAT